MIDGQLNRGGNLIEERFSRREWRPGRASGNHRLTPYAATFLRTGPGRGSGGLKNRGRGRDSFGRKACSMSRG
jgi:hypothetical protein